MRIQLLTALLSTSLTCSSFVVGDDDTNAGKKVLAPDLTADDATDAGESGVTLLGMLSEWIYPGAKFHGAESSDAAVSDICSSKSKAVLTTPESAEKVVTFYQKKLGVDSEGKNIEMKEGERVTTTRSISIQDNSVDRPLQLFIIAINDKGASTTLVVSRHASEEVTHIAWSNWRQLDPQP